jgi:hypothetical protein
LSDFAELIESSFYKVIVEVPTTLGIRFPPQTRKAQFLGSPFASQFSYPQGDGDISEIFD